MKAPDHDMDDLLMRVTDGRLDELTPEQVAALEAHLSATPAAAERLANVLPAPDPRLILPESLPSEVDWNELWERIDTATAARQPAPRAISRVLRLWPPLVAAAACLLLAVLWRTTLSPAESPWEIRLSDDVVVHELEVFGDASAFVAYSGDESGTAVIWVFGEDEDQQGA